MAVDSDEIPYSWENQKNQLKQQRALKKQIASIQAQLNHIWEVAQGTPMPDEPEGAEGNVEVPNLVMNYTISKL